MSRVVTYSYRERVARLVLGEFIPPPTPAFAAFGRGGASLGGDPLPAEDNRAALRDEFHRVAVHSKERYLTDVIAYARLDGNVVGPQTVSEAGVFDISGNLTMYVTFKPRTVGPGTLLTFRFEFMNEDVRI